MSGECLSNGRDGTLATRSARNRKALATGGNTRARKKVNRDAQGQIESVDEIPA